MTLSAGARLGPYEILAPIGAGGMGEVYRARDERLKRDVAVKVLPASFSQDADRLRRFEQEAQAAGALNHPNITAVYDLGSHDGAPYIVTELLEGETLRARLSGGAIPVRKATDYAIQIAKGLAAAHEKGIVHRDLKPENLFLTNDGRVKILDFGLAKLTQNENEGAQQTNLPTAAATEPGVVMGTLGYMSPEQVKGKPADQRSDIFSFGAILYEMLSGARAFHRDSAAETMSAILREEPPDLSATNKSVQPGLERIVRHCLEKNPEERFYSTRDVAFDLEALSGLSSSGAVVAAAGPSVMRRGVPAVAAVLGLVVAAVAGYWFHSRKGPAAPPSFHQLTFRRGVISSGRFGSDGKSVIYSAAWDGGATEIFLGRSDGPDARPFGLKNADVLAVSPPARLPSASTPGRREHSRAPGRWRAWPRPGAALRERSLENVEYADFPPDGKDIAIVRVVSSKCRLEYPIGKVIYETRGWIGEPRFSARGDRIAFIDHPTVNDDGGAVAIVDLAGKKTTVTPLYASARGARVVARRFGNLVHGGRRGRQPRAAGGDAGRARAGPVPRHRRAHGRGRVPRRTAPPGTLPEPDRARRTRARRPVRAGSVLVRLEPHGRPVAGRPHGAVQRERRGRRPGLLGLPPRDRRFAGHSPGRRQRLFHLSGRQAGALHRASDDRPADGHLSRRDRERRRSCRFRTFAPGGRSGSRTGATSSWRRSKTGHGGRVYLVDSEGGNPRPLTAEGVGGAFRGYDGKHFFGRDADRQYKLFPVEEGGGTLPVAGIEPGDTVVGPSDRTGLVYVRRGTDLPARIVLVDIATGHEEKWKDLAPADMTGIVGVYGTRITPDGRGYAISYARVLSDLYVVDGVR